MSAPEIPSATMLAALTVILTQAEELYPHVSAEAAINCALFLARPSVAVEIAARVAWAQCTAPMHTEGPAELRLRIDPAAWEVADA